MSTIFRKNSFGYTMELNCQEYRAIVRKLRGLRAPDGTRTVIDGAIQQLELVIGAFRAEMEIQAKDHPQDLE